MPHAFYQMFDGVPNLRAPRVPDAVQRTLSTCLLYQHDWRGALLIRDRQVQYPPRTLKPET